ncbi:cache domain-containing protein [Accumulibacter sp.]|jgi:signal transduction histidine kinase|nr:cache domain-containing protein [Accumulibacter sp.]
MLRKLAALSAIVFVASVGAASAAEWGTSAEAKAMLEKVILALKADREKALVMFTKGEGGFKDRDLYPYCGGPDGNFTAHPTLLGRSLKDLRDKYGKPLGADMYAAAREGEISEITYMWPRPNQTDPVAKVAFVTRIGDQVCAVGYYR